MPGLAQEQMGKNFTAWATVGREREQQWESVKFQGT